MKPPTTVGASAKGKTVAPTKVGKGKEGQHEKGKGTLAKAGRVATGRSVSLQAETSSLASRTRQ